ncbi:MAG: PAS domain-containing protein [Pseudomonadota bacterium]
MSPLNAAGLGALCAAAVAVAIAAGKRADAAVRASEQTLRSIFNGMPGLVHTMTVAGEMELINQRIVDFFGRPLEELRNWQKITHPDDVARVTASWAHALQTGESIEHESRGMGADGVYRWFQVRASPLRDADNKILRWCSLLTDIDDRKRAEEAVRASEQEMRLILDNIPGFVFTLTPEGVIEQVNQRIVDFFGVPPEQLRDWRAVAHPDDIAPVDEVLTHALATGFPCQWESRGRGANGFHRWFQTRGIPLRDADGRILRWCFLLIDIDDRKRAEEALRDNERHLRTILDTIPALVHTLTPAGEVEHVNRPILDFFGLPPDEVRDWGPLTHPDDIERVGAVIGNALRTGIPFEFESRGRRADGVYRWMQSRGNPLRDSTGTIVRWYDVVTDIDDRRRAEEALRASENELRLMVDSISGLICTNTAAGEVAYVNKTLLDYSGKQLHGLKDWGMIVHPDDLPRVAEQWRHSVETCDPFKVEVRVQRADGVYRWFQCSGLPLRGSDGSVIRWYNLLADIEDRKLAEQVLRARERDLALIIESIPALVWSGTPEGELAYVNSRIMTFTGTTFEHLVRNWSSYVHPDDVDAVVEEWSHSVRSGEPHDMQYRMRNADGRYRWIQSISQLGRDSDGRPTRWYGVLMDVDERRNTEEALRNTRARLARATQVATVGELSASIAHEINQPLSAVVTNGHACHRWLTVEPPNIPRALVSLERIIRDGRSAADVIERIRALYRHAPPDKDELSVNEVIEEVCKLIAAEARRQSINVRTELQPTLPLIRADRVQLQQVLANLTRNAIEAMETVTDGARELRIASLHEGPRVVVHVQDTGTGMPEYSTAFEPFYTTKAQGMGMGLAICRSIVEAHGGLLWATGAEPRGSVFSFALPAASLQ